MWTERDLKQMNQLTGGFLGVQNRVENWLSLLFETDAANPGQVVEHPERLVFADASVSDSEAQLRTSFYGFDKIKEAFVLRKICQPPPPSNLDNYTNYISESTIKALADNFLIHAYALWNLRAEERSQFMRDQAKLFLQNSEVAEHIGSVPFCQIPGKNEIFMLSDSLEMQTKLRLALEELQHTLQNQQILMDRAAEEKLVLLQSLETAKAATQAAVAKRRKLQTDGSESSRHRRTFLWPKRMQN